MKIVHINTSDISGGAAIAAHRLHQELLKKNVDSKMLVLNKESDELTIKTASKKVDKHLNNKIRNFFEKINFKRYEKRENPIIFSSGNYGIDIISFKEIIEADVIHLHWINDNYINLNTIKKLAEMNKKIVWTMHDMWPFTGGCHYAGNCKNYEKKCGNCEILMTNCEKDITRKIFLNKEKIFNQIDFIVVGCSDWISDCASKSSLFNSKKIYNIPNVLDTKIFKKLDKKSCRDILNLKPDKKYILFGAMGATSDPRKGYSYLKETLEILKKEKDEFSENLEILIFGASHSEEVLPFKTHFLGKLFDEYTLNIVYNAADLFVSPSVEENLANTVNESLASGTPVVAFDVGGMPDMIEHCINGYLAELKNSNDLAMGIKKIIMGNLKVENKIDYEESLNKILRIYSS